MKLLKIKAALQHIVDIGFKIVLISFFLLGSIMLLGLCWVACLMLFGQILL